MAKLTLTFDNGPEPEVTPRVLDVLDRHDVRATFFVIGRKLEARRDVAEAARSRGHRIGNHTYSHATPLGECVAPRVAEEEIGRTQELIGDLAHPDRFFRPFGREGQLGRHLLRRDCADFLIAGAYTCVLWNSIPRDWADPDGWPERALADCAARDWTLMVLHDLPTGAMEHLDRFIAEARAREIEIVHDFPADCLPVRNGVAAASLDSYVTGEAGRAQPFAWANSQ